MAGWYFSVNGRAEGPVSDDVLLDGLKSGRFTLVDLVFREGSAGWTTLGEIPEFRGAFEALPLPQVLTTSASYDEDTGKEEITSTDTPFNFSVDSVATPPPTENKVPRFGASLTTIAPSATRFSSSEPPPTSTPVSAPVSHSSPPPTFEKPSFEKFDTKMPPSPAWIVLKKKGAGFEQAGPYTEEQILERIGRGEVEYSMYAWKPGYKRWVRIGNLPEFDRRKRDRENDPVNQVVPLPKPDGTFAAIPREELAKAVEVQRRPESVAASIEPPPKETNGIDLASLQVPPKLQSMSFKLDSAQTPAAAPEVPPTVAPIAAPTAAPVAATIAVQDEVLVVPGNVAEVTNAPPASSDIEFDDEGSKTRIQRPAKPKKTGLPFYLRAAIAMVFAGFVVVGVLAAAQWWNVQKAKEATLGEEIAEAPVAKPSRKAAAPAPAAPVYEDGPSLDEDGEAPNPTAEAEEAPKKNPVAQAKANAVNELGLRPIPPSPNGATVLEIVPMKLTTPNPVLVFQTDAAVGETIDVMIRAKAGDILKWVSYSNNYLVRRSNGEIASLDLSKFSLPRGTYRVEASVGKIRKSTTMFIGVRDGEFESERRDHLKNISQVQQAEKKALFYSAQRLEKLTVQLGDQARKLKSQPAKWKKYYSDWKKLAKDGARPAMNFAKTDRPELLAFPEIFNEFSEATAELTDQAKQLDASITQKRAIATVPLPVARSFKKLRIEASKLSAQ